MPNSATTTRKQRFLTAIERGSTVISAADYAGVNHTEPYRWARKDPQFSAGWKVARASRLSALKDTAFDLALAGNVQLIMFLIARYERIPKKEPQQPVIAQVTIIPAASPPQEVEGATHDPPAEFISLKTTSP